MIYFEKPPSEKHCYVVYKDTDEGTISDKTEDGDIKLYTDIDAIIEVDEALLFDGEKYRVKHMDDYKEKYQSFFSSSTGKTRTIGITPIKR